MTLHGGRRRDYRRSRRGRRNGKIRTPAERLTPGGASCYEHMCWLGCDRASACLAQAGKSAHFQISASRDPMSRDQGFEFGWVRMGGSYFDAGRVWPGAGMRARLVETDCLSDVSRARCARSSLLDRTRIAMEENSWPVYSWDAACQRCKRFQLLSQKSVCFFRDPLRNARPKLYDWLPAAMLAVFLIQVQGRGACALNFFRILRGTRKTEKKKRQNIISDMTTAATAAPPHSPNEFQSDDSGFNGTARAWRGPLVAGKWQCSERALYPAAPRWPRTPRTAILPTQQRSRLLRCGACTGSQQPIPGQH